MQIILLSGGSGTRLWPLSNEARSKQFLRLLPTAEPGVRESMVQRVVRQMREAGISAPVTVATSVTQHDSVIDQLGVETSIVTEPSRRDTFPAICLACEYLAKEKGLHTDEVVVVMPCDPYTDLNYFRTIGRMAGCVERGDADLVLMGVCPTYPSAKYGYIVPDRDVMDADGAMPVKWFTEKPDVATAESLIAEGALWNGGVFAFRLGYLTGISRRYLDAPTMAEMTERYEEFPKISFDYEVAEKAESVAVVPFGGEWKDLGTWNTLTDELPDHAYGNVTLDCPAGTTHVINELDMPLMVIGTDNLVVAASADGILVSEKSKSENIKTLAAGIKTRPMYEERRWGTYRVIDRRVDADGQESLTKVVTLRAEASISYQRHARRSEVWTFISGEGEVVLDGWQRYVKAGDTVRIPVGMLHSVKARTPMTFIEVMIGNEITEDDIERSQYEWQ